MKNLLRVMIVATVVVPYIATADTIGVHNTGVNASDVLVPAGIAGSFWTLASEPVGATEVIGSNSIRYHDPNYFADTSKAAWVAPTASGNAGAGGIYAYDFTFKLAAGEDPATASITGIFGTDNDGSISLNGNAPVATTSFAGFGSTTAFSFTSGFVAGFNTIEVKINNGGDPTAFFVQFNSATATAIGSTAPEPSTPFLAGLGLLAVAGLGRRIRVRG